MSMLRDLNLNHIKADYVSNYLTRKPKPTEDIKPRPKSARVQKKKLKIQEEKELPHLRNLPNVQFLMARETLSLMQNR